MEESSNTYNSDVDFDELATEEYENSDYYIKYYLDNQPVENLTFDQNTDQWVLYLGKIDANQNQVLEIRKFTLKEDYLLYGDQNSIPIRKGIEVGDILREYAIEDSVDDYYKENGDVPQNYKDYESLVYQQYFGRELNKVQTINIWVTLYDKCDIGENNTSIIMINTYPFMPWGWNNRVSKVQVVGVFAGVAIYDKSWYRRHLGTLWLWGFESRCLIDLGISDKMSSGIKLL